MNKSAATMKRKLYEHVDLITRASTYSAYLTSYVPLFLTAFYLLGCGPKRLLGNFPTLLSYIISVLLIIPKLPRVKKILGSSNVFNPTGGGGCTSYLSLG